MQLNVMSRGRKFVMILFAAAVAVVAAERFVAVGATRWTNRVDALPLLLGQCHSSR